MDNIPEAQISYRKKIGTLDGDAVVEIGLKGGLHLVAVAKSGAKSAQICGVGSHRAIARHIARKKNPTMQFNDLAKSDPVPVEHFQWLLPQYEALTLAFQKAQGDD